MRCLPGLADVDHVDTVRASLPEVRLHVHLEVLGTEMRLGGKQHLDVLRRRVEDGGKVGGSHLDVLAVEAGAVDKFLWMSDVSEEIPKFAMW